MFWRNQEIICLALLSCFYSPYPNSHEFWVIAVSPLCKIFLIGFSFSFFFARLYGPIGFSVCKRRCDFFFHGLPGTLFCTSFISLPVSLSDVFKVPRQGSRPLSFEVCWTLKIQWVEELTGWSKLCSISWIGAQFYSYSRIRCLLSVQWIRKCWVVLKQLKLPSGLLMDASTCSLCPITHLSEHLQLLITPFSLQRRHSIVVLLKVPSPPPSPFSLLSDGEVRWSNLITELLGHT